MHEKSSSISAGLGPADRVGGASLAVEVVGLVKSFDGHVALDDLDLTAAEGAVTALIGPNGSGKTTTVRVLSTLLPPDRGRASVFGHDVTREPEAVRAAIGVTGQFSAIDGLLTGRENLALMADLHHLKAAAARERVTSLLERFDLVEAADRRAMTYSGGMQRRLDLAMTMVGQPRIVFLDEPTAGLDPAGRQVLWRIVRDLVDEGVTILLTTQYLEEADRLADRVALIDRGRLVAEGTPSELKGRIPGGHIRLQFPDTAALAAAREVFTEALAQQDGSSLVLASDGSVTGLRAVLDQLDRHRLAVASVSAEPADLDDVFFALTGTGPDRSAPAAVEAAR